MYLPMLYHFSVNAPMLDLDCILLLFMSVPYPVLLYHEYTAAPESIHGMYALSVMLCLEY